MSSESFWTKGYRYWMPRAVSVQLPRVGRLRKLAFEPLEDRRVLSAMSPASSGASFDWQGTADEGGEIHPRQEIDDPQQVAGAFLSGQDVDDPQQITGSFLTSTNYGDTRAASFNDVIQRSSPTCAFAAVLSAVARSSFNLTSRITEAANGYNVQLYGASLQPVTINVPFDGTLSDQDLSLGDNGEIWPAIYQRAYLTLQTQLNRDPAATNNAFEAITGRTSTRQSLQNAQQLIAVVDQIKTALEGGSPVVASSADGDLSNSSKLLPGTSGVIKNHAYTVLGVSHPVWNSLNGVTVTLRNPWGEDTSWRYYDFNHDDDKQFDEFDQEQRGLYGVDDGIIRLSWSTFVANFTSVRISALTGPSINEPALGSPATDPVFTNARPNPITIRQGETVTIDFNATDPAGRVPFFSIVNGPGYINPQSGIYTWLPTNNTSLREHWITVKAESAAYDHAVMSFQVTVSSGLPNVSSLIASRTTITDAGTDLLTLTANNVTTSVGAIDSVSFYRDSNNNGILDRTTDGFLGYGTRTGTNWAWSGYVGGVSAPSARFFAHALRFSFSDSFYSPAKSTTITVTPAPVIAPVATAIQSTQVAVPPNSTADYDSRGTFRDSAGNLRVFYTQGTTVYMQKYSQAGVAIGSRTQMQAYPSTMLADGSYVSVAFGAYPNSSTLYAQWYTAAGVASGSRFTVATNVAVDNGYVKTAADASGNLLIAYHAGGYFTEDIYAVSLSRAGVVTRQPWRVNTHTISMQKSPVVSLNASGVGVIAWLDFDQSLTIARRVTSYGINATAEFTVGTQAPGDSSMDSAINAAGDFVVTWPKQSPTTGYQTAIGARMYGSDGVAKGPEFIVDTFRGGTRGSPRVAMNDTGWTIFAWGSVGQDPGTGTFNNGLYAQMYNPQSIAVGPEFRVPTTFTKDEYLTGLVITPDADITFVWDHINYAENPALSQTFLRQYRINFAPTIASSFTFSVAENSALNASVGTVLATDPDPGVLTYALLGDSPFAINATTGAITVAQPAQLDFETKTSWPLGVRVTDDQGATNFTIVTVNILDANDAPVVTTLPTSPRYNETPGGLPVLDGATFVDRDTADYGGGQLVVDIITGRATGDQLGFLAGTGVLVDSSNVVRLNGATIGNLTQNGVTGPLAIGISPGVTPVMLQFILRSIVFRSILEAPTTAQRTVQFTVVDGSSGPSAVITKTVDVASINDAPENAAPTNLLMYPGQTVAVTGIAISDVDVGTANLSVSLSVGKGNLTLATGVVNGLTSGQIVGNGAATVTITAPLAAINATLNSASGLRYRNLSGVVGADALTIVTNDRGNSGDGGALVDTDTVAIALMPSTFTVTGQKLSVTGASTADTLSIQFISPTSFIANHNGQGGVFPTSLISQIELLGGLGNDLALVTTPAGLDTATFNALGGTITGVGYSLVFNNIETKYVFGDGEDVATFNDTAGDDLFWALPGYSLMVGSNPSYINEVIGFGPSITANSTAGFDVAQLIGSSAVEAYVGGVASSSLTGPSINFVANGFDQNYGYSGGGADTAVLNGSSGTDTMYGFNAYSILVASNILQYVVGYTDVTGNAGTGTGDIAILYDSQGDDTFVAGPTTARLSGAGYSNRANGFDQVHANAFGGNDTATLDGSTGNDVFYGYSTHAQLYSSGVYFLQTNRFELTHVNLSSGSGNDLAFLFDGLLNDQFTASGNQAELIYANGARNRLTAFDAVYAYSQNGGTNRKTVTNPLAFGLVFNGSWA